MNDMTQDPDFPMTIDMDDNGNLTIEWDEKHPVTKVFNTWTEQDFIDAIMKRCREIVDE